MVEQIEAAHARRLCLKTRQQKFATTRAPTRSGR